MASSFTTIHLMGDSTMANKDLSDGKPERGWGMMFPNFVDSTLHVVNYAQNGRSTKSFIDKGLWDKVYNALQPGDYVFIEFGHNDAKADDPERYAAPFGAYQDNLRTFIRGAREKGATPILLTPVARRWFKEGKLDRNCHTDYPAAMKQVADEMGVTLLDITTPTLDWIESLGDEASAPYFMNLPAGKYACAPEGKTDNTHTVAAGARKVTEIVCEALKKQVPAIGDHLVHYDIVVDRNGFGDYMTVQDAIDAVPNYSHEKITTILIKAGTYKECIDIPHTKFRMKISGQGADRTILTYDRYAKQVWPGSGFPVGTSGSASIYIHSSYVTFEDITFENTAGEGKEIGQAVAVFTDGDFLFFHRCRFIGNQDTLVAGPGYETLFVIPFSDGRGRWNYTFAVRSEGSSYAGGATVTRGGDAGPVPTMWFDYDKNDVRRDITCVNWRWNADDEPELVGIQRWYFGKYRWDWMTRNPYKGGNDDGVKPVVLRYADILLMAAEIANEQGDLNYAKEQLLKVRERAFKGHEDQAEAYVEKITSQEAMFDAIVDERAFEFCGEMTRKFDLIRWGLLKEKMDEAKTKMIHLRDRTGEYADVNHLGDFGDVYYQVDGKNLIIYGFSGEAVKPAGAWEKKADYFGKTVDSKGADTGLYDALVSGIYSRDPEQYMFWPIYNDTMTNSQGRIKNDYGYESL